MADIHKIFGACNLRAWLGPPLARCCDTLCTFSFTDDAIFAHNGPHGGVSISLQRVTSLHRRVQAAASYWLHPVLDDGGCQD